jgi:transposase
VISPVSGSTTGSSDAREARHFQTIWLLAKGHSVSEVVEMTSFGRRWIEQLAARYNAEGPEDLVSRFRNC